MKYNLWKHIRFAGAVINIIAVLAKNLPLLCVGMCMLAVGVVGAIDRLEKLVEEKDNVQ